MATLPPLRIAWSMPRAGWRFASWPADRRGVAAVEFALIAPIFIAVLLGMAQVAIAVSVLYRMHDVVSDAGRRVAIGELDAVAAERLISLRLNGVRPQPGANDPVTDGSGGAASSGKQYKVLTTETADSIGLAVELPFEAINVLNMFSFLNGKRLSISLDVPRLGS